MNKSKRALIQIVVSLLLAGIAGILIFKWTSTMNTPKVVTKPEETVPVVVVKGDLERGMKLNKEMLEVRNYTVASQPTGSYAKPEEIIGRVLNQAVSTNEALTTKKLADPSVMGGGVSALIEPGKRAMAVKGNEVMGLSGFVRPGDKVDVIVSLTIGRNDTPVTKLVLEQIKVIATGTQLSPPDEEGKTASVDVYTLELTPAQSERLALAATQGTLHFALRNEQDTEKVLTTGSDVPRAIASLRPKPKAPRKTGPKVEVITGSTRSQVKF